HRMFAWHRVARRHRIILEVFRRSHSTEPFAQITLVEPSFLREFRAGDRTGLRKHSEYSQPVTDVGEGALQGGAEVIGHLPRECFDFVPIERSILLGHDSLLDAVRSAPRCPQARGLPTHEPPFQSGGHTSYL